MFPGAGRLEHAFSGFGFGGYHAREDQSVSYQSGGSRIQNAFCGVVAAPFLILGGAFVSGWNEKHAVCQSSAIGQAERSYVEVGCTPESSVGDGQLVYFSCDFTKDGLQELSPPGSFSNSLKFQGVGMRWTSQMWQCIESESSKTEKNSAGGGTRTVTTYSYSLDWASKPIDSYSFHNQPGLTINGQPHPCGDSHNPPWPSDVPLEDSVLAEEARAGSHVIPSTFLRSVPLDAPLDAASPPSGWQYSGSGSYQSDLYSQGSKDVGRIRMSFFGNDWVHPTVSVLGEESGGVISTWSADGSWGCSGSKVGRLEPGEVDAEDFFDKMQGELNLVTAILRIVGFIVMWVGFCLCFGPLEVFADCIPFVGPFLGDSIRGVTNCLSCIPACVCFTLIAGIMWIGMRPLVGGTLLGLVLVVSFASCWFYTQHGGRKDESRCSHGYGSA
eukprot:TRINITY_DN56913_c0_g1_i1.p1 TRINITY_DN56913_c0_g1~~TRINITY_DN56913_c0_g1_i1.p1  ORF type:complete len:457 (+),score=32.22 TRINITY_DN56913_c0_g1_i1:47-1372(+)